MSLRLGLHCNFSSCFVKHVHIIVSGFAAGAYFNTHGDGGADLQCMPLDPEYDKFGFGGAYALLHGTEYETGKVGIFSDRTDQQNMPCARCYAPRSANMMIPAKRTCPKHWSKEYEGLLNLKEA